MHFHKDLKFRLTRYGLIFKELTFNQKYAKIRKEIYFQKQNMSQSISKVFWDGGDIKPLQKMCSNFVKFIWHKSNPLISNFSSRRKYFRVQIYWRSLDKCKGKGSAKHRNQFRKMDFTQCANNAFLSKSDKKEWFCHFTTSLVKWMRTACSHYNHIINGFEQQAIQATGCILAVVFCKSWRLCRLHLEVWSPCGRELIPKQAPDFCRFSVKCSQTTKRQKQIAFLGC